MIFSSTRVCWRTCKTNFCNDDEILTTFVSSSTTTTETSTTNTATTTEIDLNPFTRTDYLSLKPSFKPFSPTSNKYTADKGSPYAYPPLLTYPSSDDTTVLPATYPSSYVEPTMTSFITITKPFNTIKPNIGHRRPKHPPSTVSHFDKRIACISVILTINLL